MAPAPENELHLLDILPVMLFTSRPNGFWDYVNPAFCTYSGHEPEALIGLRWVDLVHEDERGLSLSRWQATIRSGVPFLVEQRLRNADGGYQWFRTEAVPSRNPAGTVVRWAGIATLIAGDQQMEHARTLRHTAEHARDESDSLLAIAAHELRSPLTVLLGHATLLQRRLNARVDADPGDIRVTALLVEQSLRISKLINALLDVAQIDHGELSLSTAALDLNELTQRVVQSLQPTFPYHNLKLYLGKEPLFVMGDTLRLEQVVQNVIQNAVKYSPAGGTIDMAVRAEGTQARIDVRDHGVGITPEIIPALFQRFFRARSRNGFIPGLGIGLYICKTIMDLHGGSITVESSEGAGSTFTLRLPRL